MWGISAPRRYCQAIRDVNLCVQTRQHHVCTQTSLFQSNPDSQGQNPLPLTHLPFPLTVVFQCAMGALESMAPLAQGK